MSPTANAHRPVIEVGPGTIRRLCCATTPAAAEDVAELVREALGAVDDPVALIGGRPVAVDSLWRALLRSLNCARGDGLALVHPSWWSSARVDLVTAAAKAVADDVQPQPRSWVLAHASDVDCEATVEIAERLVAISGAGVVAIPRTAATPSFAEEVVTAIAGMTRNPRAVVAIDAPGTVAGASALAASIAAALRDSGGEALEIGDARLRRLARSAFAVPGEPRCTTGSGGARSHARRGAGLAGAAVVLTGLSLAVSTVTAGDRHGASSPIPVQTAPTTFLVEGRVTLKVPADWPTQRVVSGPGSARVQVTSPSDPEVALHVTQSPVVGETLSATAERLKRAMDAEPAGLFVDFNPAGTSGERPAVTYREVRATHHVRWTVLVDGPVRISIGCQSRPGHEQAVRDACEQAVRSAHAIG